MNDKPMLKLAVAGWIAALLVFGSLALVLCQPAQPEMIAAQEVTISEHVTQLVLDSEGAAFDPYQIPDPLQWQSRFRCRLQQGEDGYGKIAAPVVVVPFTVTVGSEIEPISIRWDTSNLRNGSYSVACRLEMMNWMGDVPVFAIGSMKENSLQTVDGVGLQIVEVFTLTQGIGVYLPIFYRRWP